MGIVSSIQKQVVSRSAVKVGGVGGEAPLPFFLNNKKNKMLLDIFFLQNFKSSQIYMKDAEFAESRERSSFRIFSICIFKVIVLSMDGIVHTGGIVHRWNFP